MASENGAFRRKLALRHGIREDRQSIPAAVSLLAGGLSVLGQRQRSTAWAGASASPQKADQNTSHTSRLWYTIVDHWPSRGQMGDPTAREDEHGNEDHRICISHERMQASTSGDQSCRWPR